MSEQARLINQQFLATMENAPSVSVLAKIREIWWPYYLDCFSSQGAKPTLNALDACMDQGREMFERRAEEYAFTLHRVNTSQFEQARMQYVKSNTGKMFEKFVGLALAHALLQADSCYCIAPFVGPFLKHCAGLKQSDFWVHAKLGEAAYRTHVDADLFTFHPTSSESEIHLVSMKSTLKDRFHNVAFWNLLRLVAIAGSEPNIRAENVTVLKKVRYVAICSDLAKEQKDFGTEAGARNLLCFDAALLDGAYVTAAAAKGLGLTENHFGPTRDSPFAPLSSYYSLLAEQP